MTDLELLTNVRPPFFLRRPHTHDLRRRDLASLVQELGLNDSVDDLLIQLGAGSSGRISCPEFLSRRSKLYPWTDLVDTTDRRSDEGVVSQENSLEKRRHNIGADELLRRKWNEITSPDGKFRSLSAANPQDRRLDLDSLTNSIHMSALGSLQREIESLSRRLQEVELERDNLKRSMINNGTRSSSTTLDDNLQDDSTLSNDELELQCQRYEERMVELHSVIAELTRKLQSQEDDVIREESEFEDTQSIVTDSCAEDDECNDGEDEDYNSLAFERDLERNALFRHNRNPGGGGVSRNSRIYGSSSSDSFSAERAEYEAEISRLHEKIKESQEESQKLTDELCERERHLVEQQLVIDQLQLERDAFKRQVDDIKTTVEYQEARMDRRSAHALGASTGSPLHSTSSGRSSSERRSLRRKRHDKHAAISGVLSGPSTRESTPMSSCSREPLRNTNKAITANPDENQVRELKMELERATSKMEHLRSQNEVLTLTLEDSKSLTDRLTVLLGKYESNAGALQLGLNYCDHMVESYDVLVALLETEADILGCQDPEKKRQARNNRKSAEIVARHLVSRVDKSLNRSDSGIQTSHHLDSSLPWEDSSGYSQTTSSTSTTSSCLMGMGSSGGGGGGDDFGKSDESRLRDHISSLKSIRASIQNSIVELEPLHHDPDLPLLTTSSSGTSTRRTLKESKSHVDLEHAVLQQELMASREEKADLRAKVYLLEKEKTNMDLIMADRISIEQMLRTHIQHLQEELAQVERGFQGSAHLMSDKSTRESQLKQRVESLLATLDKISKNGELRQKQSQDLMDDLKRANSTLTEALDKNKKKYLSKLRRMEQQMVSVMTEKSEKSSTRRCPSASTVTASVKSSIPTPIQKSQ
ncbi:hypothetical protein TCAL_03782 [Tigriopus californicus]|uniref:Harmonin-binding protein USHBP1 PDZ-binding domain-containing protein n=1 Tax=Tigriopus californicus TaxID=6832 RepID=A0A553NVB7_TIGCA|nr:colorectal mutant cancer protein-like isoform X2 [Tigriopus californicus]TRY69370.1 hypothetical protein TCAL_03782 [Tigriopus californicus]